MHYGNCDTENRLSSGCVGRMFVDQCFRPFSAALIDDGVYKALCKESGRYIQAVNNAVEQSVLLLVVSGWAEAS